MHAAGLGHMPARRGSWQPGSTGFEAVQHHHRGSSPHAARADPAEAAAAAVFGPYIATTPRPMPCQDTEHVSFAQALRAETPGLGGRVESEAYVNYDADRC
jgi:hypothetical protein